MAERLAWLLVLIALFPAALAAASDAGPTLPIETFYAERRQDGAQPGVSELAADYPVATRGLRRQRLRQDTSLASSFAAWMPHPVALIADDQASLSWLVEQGDALRTVGATVLVVRVSSSERMRAIRNLRPELPMAPADVSSLARPLQEVNAAVYPLVILEDGSVRQDIRHLARVATRSLTP